MSSHYHIALSVKISDHSKFDRNAPLFQCLYPYEFDSQESTKHLEKVYLFAIHADEIPQVPTEKEYLIADFKHGGTRCKVLYPYNDSLNPERIFDNILKIKVLETGNGIVRPGVNGCSPETKIIMNEEGDRYPYAIKEENDENFYLPMFCFPDMENPFTSAYFAFCRCSSEQYKSFKNAVNHDTQWGHTGLPVLDKDRTSHLNDIEIIR